MTSEPKRKLAAIMFTDMVGYTALMQKDESKARELIEMQRGLMAPYVKKHDGEILQYVGDGTFCTFNSAIEAVNAALEIQRVLDSEPEINLRIGIHVGDVVVKGDEVYGDGVNVASRLEPLAEAGGVCVSARVRDDIKNQPGLSLSSLGKKDLKNVDEEMEVFAVTPATDPSSITPSETKKPPAISKKVNLKWIGVAVVITALIIISLKFDLGTIEVESKEEASSLRIAVLPFDNMSEDLSNEFFADGITDDILTQLSKIKSLEVISRTSILQYKNTTKSLREIGIELGVSTILEGSVRRGGNRIRINAQLIDARTDEHIWAETYDRDLDDIFAIQSDVALKIANALKASLSPDEENRINEKSTNNLDAYDFYLKGNILYDEYNSNFEWRLLEDAIASYEKAVAADPVFIIAYSRLARTHLRIYFAGRDQTDERRTKANRIIERMSEIDPDHPEVQLAKGYYYYWGYRNYDEALKYLLPTLDKQPNNSDVSQAVGYVYRRMGKWNDAIAAMKKAVDLDPRSHKKTRTIAQTYRRIRKWEQAERFADRLILLKPESARSYDEKFFVYISRGDLEESMMVINNAMKNIDPNKLLNLQVNHLYYERNFSEALILLESDTAKWFVAKAVLHLKLGQSEKANSYFDSLKIQMEDLLTKTPKNAGILSTLGFAYAGLGRKDEAIEKGVDAVELFPLSKDAWIGADRIENLARIYTMVGEYDKAIDQLEFLLSIPSEISVEKMKIDPDFDSIRDHPRFIKLVAD